MSWLDTFKNDERSLFWLVKYIHENLLFGAPHFPSNIQEARDFIRNWESKHINNQSARLNYDLKNLMENYFECMLPIEDFDWLSIKHPKQLCWVLFYINLKPIDHCNSTSKDLCYRNFASNIKEIYPLIIKTFDTSASKIKHKQDYLLNLKCAYSEYAIANNPLYWLDKKDEERSGPQFSDMTLSD